MQQHVFLHHFLKFTILSIWISQVMASTPQQQRRLFLKTPSSHILLQTEGSAVYSRENMIEQSTEDGNINFRFRLGVVPRGEEENRLGENLSNVVLQAEEARLSPGVLLHDHEDASEGRYITSFGDPPFDGKPEYIAFDNIQPAHGLAIAYTNGSGRTNRCGLYVDGERAHTLEFPPTESWQPPFSTLTYDGLIQGSVMLRVDWEDLDANQGFCCFVDYIELQDVVPQNGKIQVVLPGILDAVEASDQALSVQVKAHRCPFYILAMNENGTQHRSVTFRQTVHPHNFVDPAEWERFTVLYTDFDPPISASDRTKLNDLKLVLETDDAVFEGDFHIGEVLTSPNWPSTPPENRPVKDSTDYGGIAFTGRGTHYTEADTFYPSWASDGNLYSPFTDGRVQGLFSRSDLKGATTGMVIIQGDDPMDLKVDAIGLYTSRADPLGTRYPCGSLLQGGVWYYGTYNIGFPARPDNVLGAMGPFVGFRTSRDYGHTWKETPRTPVDNLFGVDVSEDGSELRSPVRIGAPHFIDFGQNNVYSPDGKAYLVGHGTRQIGNYEDFTWTMGDEINLVRVLPSEASINNRDAYEYFAGFDSNGEPTWSKRIDDMKPLVEWPGRTGCVTATYNPVLEKYLLCVTTAQQNVYESFDTYIMEADRVEGPYRLVSYMEDFGRQAYFVNIPSKFIGMDGHTMWLCYSANYTEQAASPRNSRYAMTLQEFKLLPSSE